MMRVSTMIPARARVSRPILLGIGWSCVVIGFVGVFVPGLPTTTFLLIAAWCFLRSSDKAYSWLLNHRVLGPYVRDFLSGKGMPVKSKIIALSMIWLTCGSSALFFVDNVYAKVGIIACAVIGSVVILRVRTASVGVSAHTPDSSEMSSESTGAAYDHTPLLGGVGGAESS